MTLMTVVTLAAWVLVPMAWGWDAYTVTSGSMTPLVRPGDVVVASGHPQRVRPGSLVVIEPELAGGQPITHRVVEVLPDGTFRTKGDANPQPDSRLVTLDQIAGSARLVVPMAGLVQLHFGRAAPVLGIAIILLSLLLPPLLRRRRPGKSLVAAGLACVVTIGAGTAGTSWVTSRAVFSRTATAGQSWISGPSYSAAVLASGPTSYWRMGTTSTVPDVMGGPAMNMVNTTAVRPGAIRNDVDGSLSFIRTPTMTYGSVASNTANTFTGPFTVAAWTNSPGGLLHRLVIKIQGSSLNYLLAWDGTSGKYMRFVLDTTGTNVRLSAVSSGAVWPTDGSWHFVVGVFDGTSATLYVDAVHRAAASTQSTPPVSAVTNSAAMTASEPPASGNGLVGDVDEVTLWRRALSQPDIQALYDLGRK